MFRNLVESAPPKAAFQHRRKILAVISMLWVVTFFTTLVEEVVLAKAELQEPFGYIGVMPVPPPNFSILTQKRFATHLLWKNTSFERRAYLKVYPKLPASLTSTFVVEILVATDGTVLNAKLLKGNRLFANQVMEAALQWKFEPWPYPTNSTPASTSIQFRFIRGCLIQDSHY